MTVDGPGNGVTAPNTSIPGPNAPASADQGLQRRRTNPLGELIATEVRYVHELGLAIRRVAAAWNPGNFPPREVDTMFRSLEVVLRTNGEFLRALQEIGPNPASPKGLGNLLMHWVDKLQPPYSQYVSTFVPHLNSLPSVQANLELPGILAQLSKELPRSAAQPTWTLDDFFELPLARLRFYKKLYSRLLRSTQPGRSDHELLANANRKLDLLVERAQQCKSLPHTPGRAVEGPPSAAPPPFGTVSSPLGPAEQAPPVRAPIRSPVRPPLAGRPLVPGSMPNTGASAPGGVSSPLFAPPLATLGRPPPPMGMAPEARNPVHPTSQPPQEGAPMIPITQSMERQTLAQIQNRIDSTSTVDIFSLEPKHCRLQMAPPTLPFQRQLRINDSVRLVLLSNNREYVFERARLVLLTDLLLVAEDMAPYALAPGAQDVRLMFPPLSGRFVDLHDQIESNPQGLRLSIMKRVELLITLPSQDRKAQWVRELQACKQFGAQNRPQQQPRSSAEQPRPTAPPGVTSPAPVPTYLPTSPSVRPSPQAPMVVSSSAPSLPMLGSPSAPIRPPRPAGPGTGPPRATPGPAPGPTPRSARPPVRPSTPTARPPPSSMPLQKLMQPLPLGPPVNGSTAVGMPSPAAPAPPSAPSGVPPPASPVPTAPQVTPAPATMAGSTQNRPALPPLLLPKSATNEALPLVPVAEQDGGRVASPVLTEALTRASSVTSQESFPRVGARALDSPDVVGARTEENYVSSPLVPSSLSRSFGSVTEEALANVTPGASAVRPKVTVQGNAPTGTPDASRPTEVSTPPLPSEMFKSISSRRSTDWMREEDVDATAVTAALQHEQQSFHLCAQMRCKVFLKQSYAQWRSLGSARLRLYHLLPSRANQLVVVNEKKVIISSIVLPVAVERVGKTGVAVELSDMGRLTGIVYMLHMRSDESANGLFEQLLQGSGRTPASSPPPPT
ncbi:hypothetical protein MNAN1_001381 [Malassezia nana]|uniref:DH domain-containing protein n=1 Tax=Malassezia nana TaxID=180528 RepID=A0AAF0EPA8_9BASI|nr:hypothetical protein MNAN1_001381 [Malassezia nana]